MRTLLFLALLSAASCSLERLAVRIGTVEANNRVEAYRETTWNRENNRPGEERAAREELKQFIRDNK